MTLDTAPGHAPAPASAPGLAGLIGLIADKTTGMAHAVLAAPCERTRSGQCQCQCVEVPMFETKVAFTLAEHLGGLSFKPPAGPAGSACLLAGGRQPAPTLDGDAALPLCTAAHWQRFFTGACRPDLQDNLQDKHGADDRRARNARNARNA